MCNYESFLKATTPVVPQFYTFPSLISCFKLPSAFGIEVSLLNSEKIYFIPTLSALTLPDFSFYETVSPFLRPNAYAKLKELKITTDPDTNSWLALLWLPISKVPPGKTFGSILVYYKLRSEIGLIDVLGLITFRIASDWAKVIGNNGEIDVEKSKHWEKTVANLRNNAYKFGVALQNRHLDFGYMSFHENSEEDIINYC